MLNMLFFQFSVDIGDNIYLCLPARPVIISLSSPSKPEKALADLPPEVCCYPKFIIAIFDGFGRKTRKKDTSIA